MKLDVKIYAKRYRFRHLKKLRPRYFRASTNFSYDWFLKSTIEHHHTAMKSILDILNNQAVAFPIEVEVLSTELEAVTAQPKLFETLAEKEQRLAISKLIDI